MLIIKILVQSYFGEGGDGIAKIVEDEVQMKVKEMNEVFGLFLCSQTEKKKSIIPQIKHVILLCGVLQQVSPHLFA